MNLRFLIVLLLVGNLAFLAWSLWIHEEPVLPQPVGEHPVRLVLATEAAVPEALPRQGAPLPPGCLSFGPFTDPAEVGKISTSLEERGLKPRQRVGEGTVWTGHWISLPVADRDQGLAVVRRLKQMGVTDAYVMPEEEGSLVSLGLFSERPRALRRLDEVRALGFEAVISERERLGALYWVEAEVADPFVLEGLGGERREDGRILRLRVESCPGD
ncbi:MAG: hypothetical protein ACO37Y_09545 [Steroidobacteraceae bacterium]